MSRRVGEEIDQDVAETTSVRRDRHIGCRPCDLEPGPLERGDRALDHIPDVGRSQVDFYAAAVHSGRGEQVIHHAGHLGCLVGYDLGNLLGLLGAGPQGTSPWPG